MEVSPETLRYVVTAELSGGRLDVLVTSFLETTATALQVSRSRVRNWIEDGRISVNSQVVTRAASTLRVNDTIEIRLPPQEPAELVPDPNVVLDILFEDEQLLVVNKPAGLVVHPGAGATSGTLVNGVLAHLGTDFQVGSPYRPGVVHRLDKDTTGIMVLAKTEFSYLHLVSQFQPPRTISRQYVGLATRAPSRSPQGHIDLPIGRHHRLRKKMAVVAGGKPALTDWRLEESFSYGVRLRLSLHTGRTHQIRVHLKAVGAPLLGDPDYGDPIGSAPSRLRPILQQFGRQALHAESLELLHPLSNTPVSLRAPLPEDMIRLEEALRTQ